jgi:hypothetical protein
MLPAFERAVIEMKKISIPTITLGSASGLLNLDTKNAKETNINGKNIVVQEKRSIKKPLIDPSKGPLRGEKEIIIRAARARNVI